MIPKKIGIPFSMLVLTLAIWQVFFDQSKIDSNDNNKNSITSSNIDPQGDAVSSVGAILDSASNNNEIIGKDSLIIVDTHKDDVWGGQYKSTDYAAYDASILASLADAGDVKAMKILALRYLELALNNEISSEQLMEYSEKKNQYTSKAIIYGDREMLSLMPELKKEISHLESTSLTPEEKHSTILNVLAHYEFMGLRGSMRDKYDGQRLFFKTYSDSLGLPSSLSESDKNTVRAKAKEIYDAQEKKRIELGLGPFDNSNSESVLKAYEMQRQLYLSEMGSLAIE